MDIDPDRLTEALAGRLPAVVPDGFDVRSAGGMLWYSNDGLQLTGQLSNYRVGGAGTDVRASLAAHGDTADQGVAGMATPALGEVQDYVDEATRDPWPGVRTPPRAFAAVRDQALHLWYGGQDVTSPVVLALEPIPLAQIQRLP